MIGTKAYIRKTLNSLLKRYDHVIVNERFNQVVDNNIVYEWQKVSYQAQPGYTVSKLPEGATDYLVTSNPRLKELQTRYANFNNDVTTPLVWTDDHVSSEDMQYFPYDNQFVQIKTIIIYKYKVP